MAANSGFGHVSVQWDYVPQRALLGEMREACDAFGLTFGVWEAEPQPGTGAAAVAGAQAGHYVAQAETPRDWTAIVNAFRAECPDMSAAVVTTFWGIGATATGYDPSISAPVIAAGFRCLTEAYVNADPNATPDNLDWVATEKLGWPGSQPTIGVWGGFPAFWYTEHGNLAAHPGYWVWLAETMLPLDWATLRSFNLA